MLVALEAAIAKNLHRIMITDNPTRSPTKQQPGQSAVRTQSPRPARCLSVCQTSPRLVIFGPRGNKLSISSHKLSYRDFSLVFFYGIADEIDNHRNCQISYMGKSSPSMKQHVKKISVIRVAPDCCIDILCDQKMIAHLYISSLDFLPLFPLSSVNHTFHPK